MDAAPVYGEFTFAPIQLLGHDRVVTDVKYNRAGDLLFTASKDSTAQVWYSDNGERLGSYEGHNGAIWGLDVNWDTTMLMTGGSDNCAKIWDVQTGTCLNTLDFAAPIRAVGFSHGDKQVLCVMENLMGAEPCVLLYDMNELKGSRGAPTGEDQFMKPVQELKLQRTRINKGLWGATNDEILTCGDDHTIVSWDTRQGKPTNQVTAHRKGVSNITLSNDYAHLISASADMSAALWDRKTLEKLKTYETTRPVNAAVISPSDPFVLIGGGQKAEEVTTSQVGGKFEVRFFHMILGEEIGSVKGHFGPVNALAFCPNGNAFASGSEDGCVRVHPLRT